MVAPALVQVPPQALPLTGTIMRTVQGGVIVPVAAFLRPARGSCHVHLSCQPLSRQKQPLSRYKQPLSKKKQPLRAYLPRALELGLGGARALALERGGLQTQRRQFTAG